MGGLSAHTRKKNLKLNPTAFSLMEGLSAHTRKKLNHAHKFKIHAHGIFNDGRACEPTQEG